MPPAVQIVSCPRLAAPQSQGSVHYMLLKFISIACCSGLSPIHAAPQLLMAPPPHGPTQCLQHAQYLLLTNHKPVPNACCPHNRKAANAYHSPSLGWLCPLLTTPHHTFTRLHSAPQPQGGTPLQYHLISTSSHQERIMM